MPSKSTKSESSRQAIIDELGEVERQYRLWTPGVNPHAARLAELSAIVRGWYNQSPPESTFVVEGKRYRLQMKACQYRRSMSAEAQEKAFHATQKAGVNPYTVFRATQEAIAKLHGEAYLNEIAPKFRTGPRNFTLVPLTGPQLMRKDKAA